MKESIEKNTILKKTGRGGRQMRSYDGGKTWISTQRFDQERWDKETKEDEEAHRKGEILIGIEGVMLGRLGIFLNKFEEIFRESCFVGGLEYFQKRFEFALSIAQRESKKNFYDGIDEAEFIDKCIIRSEALVKQYSEDIAKGIDTFRIPKRGELIINYLKIKRSKHADENSQEKQEIISDQHFKKLIDIGLDCGFWDENKKIVLKRGGVYSCGKKFLGQLSICLKELGYIPKKFTSDKIGNFFCNHFHIEITERKDPKHNFREFDESSKEPKIYHRIMSILKRNGMDSIT